MLTVSLVRNKLSEHFAPSEVRQALASLRSQGLIPRGNPRRAEPVRLSPGNAITIILATSLGDVEKAKIASGWRAVDVAPGYQRALGHAIDGLSDVRLSGLLHAQVLTNRPTSWRISLIEAHGAGLSFGPHSDGPIPAYRARVYIDVPASVIGALANAHEPAESSRQLAELLLRRVGQHVRPKVLEAAE